VALRVDALGLRGGSEQLGHVLEALFFSLLGKGGVFHEGLAFTGKGVLQIFVCRRHK